MKYIFLFLSLVLCTACSSSKQDIVLETGSYTGFLKITQDQNLPFTFEVLSNSTIRILNSYEVIDVNDITFHNDSIIIQPPVFEGVLKAVVRGNQLKGYYLKPNLNIAIPFFAEKDTIRFKSAKAPEYNISGNWQTIFSPNIPKNKYLAKGIFHQKGSRVNGTFRTVTGDYRFLEGVVDGDSLKLSTFDGAHAFLFKAKLTDSTMSGMFYSGNHWKEPFTGTLNNDFDLPDANSLTYLKEHKDQFIFSFPNQNGTLISSNDDRFKNKVTVVQLMGSWCPNCLDESKFYTQYYKSNKDKDIEFVALAFEVANSQEKAFKAIYRLTSTLGIPYPILLAQYGSSDKSLAQEKLPMLDTIIAYPTTLILDKKGRVRKIHTGFNGPATGDKYVDFKQNFEQLIEELLQE